MNTDTIPTGTSLLRLMCHLLATQPAWDAPDTAKADWFDEKARVLELIAATDRPDATYIAQRAQFAREMAAECRKAGEQ
ncbi:hypothetical protein M8C13_40390 [Crossiella sp. SN42]|uniref:hypothetical protein n=1 Tax=Crossiella sp. SN42 TaxID=2944808 RepID=UPI00207CB65E|nr:hypothetical protein [Crossiella sp. SN42]MCO1582027.1 hypothetical protein [Crossiella sp. SN42]